MLVKLPTPLRAYTGGQREVEADGANLRELFDALDRRYPGIRFRVINEQGRIREHIRLFVNRKVAPDLTAPLAPGDTVEVILAISGGSATA